MTSLTPFTGMLIASIISFAGAVRCDDDQATGANRNRRDVINSYGTQHLYTKPVYLPILPYYEVDIPEQEGKFFGGRVTTVYQTIIVKETVRPVCLLVDGNVPSCDQVIHSNNQNNYRPKHLTELDAMDDRRPAAVVDYQAYFVEPSRPDVKIEMTEIPFRGAFLLTDTSVELQAGDEDATATAAERPHETPPLQDVRPAVTVEAVQNGGRQQQFLQNVFGAAGSAVTSGLSGLVPNIAGLAGGLVPNVAGGLALSTAVVTNAMGGGGGQKVQVTVFVTRVDKVVDDRVTATLVAKNCMPDFGQLDALRPCAVNPYQQYYLQQLYQTFQRPPKPPQTPPFQQPSQPSAMAVDIVSKVNGLVKDFVDAQTSDRGPHLYHTPSINGPS